MPRLPSGSVVFLQNSCFPVILLSGQHRFPVVLFSDIAVIRPQRPDDVFIAAALKIVFSQNRFIFSDHSAPHVSDHQRGSHGDPDSCDGTS